MCPVENLTLLGENWLILWFFYVFGVFLPTCFDMTPHFLCLSSADPPKIIIFGSQNYLVTLGKPGITLKKFQYSELDTFIK